ncbi:MAG TPA: universal stress protein [Candidatus Dormibacteraeota bacterium]|nr:universal stress protein [Candidatus Dormibacteraeota bacterium]
MHLVTLVRGDVSELDAVEAAALLADETHAPVVGCVLPVRPRPGLDLVRTLAGDCVGRWEAWGDVARRAFGGVRAMVVSGHTWRSAARAIWPALGCCPLYVQRRPPALPRHVLVAVDSARTLSALAERLQPLTARRRPRITLAYATVPTWASTLSAAMGYPAALEGASPLRFPWPLLPGDATGVCVPTTPLWAIRTLADDLRPDLVVMGLHRHRVREPSLAHPTAWLLSRELPMDVLLCPVS